MRHALYFLVFLISAQINLSAQESRSAPIVHCPSISIECPWDAPFEDPAQPVTFAAKVDGADKFEKLTFNWTISDGVIQSGQGTPTITVSVVGNSITAKVEVQGLSPDCSNSQSCSMNWCPIVTPRFDQYGDIEAEAEMARLDNFAIELNKNPLALACLIAYAGRRAYANEANARLERAKDYLVNSRKISGDRIVIVDGGYQDVVTVELYIVPPGLNPPVAYPTVEADEVQIIRESPRKSRSGARRH